MIPRPDEQAMLAEIERDERFRKNLKSGAQAAVGLFGTAAGGGLASRILPFINEFIPPELAIKGISKINPKIGDLLKRGQSMGLDVEEGLNFVKDKLMPREEQPSMATPKEKRNIIQQYDPELDTYMREKIKKGVSPLHAGSKAMGHERFKKAINRLTKDHKISWMDAIQSVYGTEKKSSNYNQQQTPQPIQEQPQVQGQGQGQAALMAILQKIQQARGAQ